VFGSVFEMRDRSGRKVLNRMALDRTYGSGKHYSDVFPPPLRGAWLGGFFCGDFLLKEIRMPALMHKAEKVQCAVLDLVINEKRERACLSAWKPVRAYMHLFRTIVSLCSRLHARDGEIPDPNARKSLCTGSSPQQTRA